MAGTMFLQHWLVFVGLLRLLSGWLLVEADDFADTTDVVMTRDGVQHSLPGLFQLYQVSSIPI